MSHWDFGLLGDSSLYTKNARGPQLVLYVLLSTETSEEKDRQRSGIATARQFAATHLLRPLVLL